MTPLPAIRRLALVTMTVALAAGCTTGGGGGGGGTPSARGDGCPTAQPDALGAGESRVVTVDTEVGAFEITVEADLSPIAAGNFVALAECGFYDGVVFHRVIPGFVVQGGDGEHGKAAGLNPNLVGTGGPGYMIQDEPVTAEYGRGTVAMARSPRPNSVGSQFFVVLSEEARRALESANTYQIIGSVTSGMETVDAIAAAADRENPTDPVTMSDVSVAQP